LIFIPGSRAEESVEETKIEKKEERKTLDSIQLLSPPPLLPVSSSVLVSGTKTVGPTGDYPSITAAIVDIQAQSLDGALTLELLPTYNSSVETLPLNFTNLPGISATNTVTLRPQAGATNLAITGNNATAIVNLQSVQFVTIDGRPGGVGTAKELTIENTNTTGTTGATVRFINNASNNAVRHTVIKGATTGASSGVVLIAGTTGGTGNDNNTIDNNVIQDGISTPRYLVYSFGSVITSQFNNNNTISNNDILNFYATSGDSAGVRLDTGNTNWTISDNYIYQTASRASITGNAEGIIINAATGVGFTLANNVIGGSAPNAGGTPWTTTGTAANYRFTGIHLNVSPNAPTNVQNNIVGNFVWTTSSTNSTLPGAWSGIFLQSGLANITGNTIGSGTGTGSISVTTSGNNGTTFGIGYATSAAPAISNNIIGSITTNGTSNLVSAPLIAVRVDAGTPTISNNTIGSTTTANSLNAATSAIVGSQQVTGVHSLTSGGTNIMNNTIANLNNNYTGTAAAGQVRGIVTTIGSNTIDGNTVRNLSTTSANAGTGSAASVVGILQDSITGIQTVSRNTIHSLSNTSAASSGATVTGIYFKGSTTATHRIDSNFIHSFPVTNPSFFYIGMSASGGVAAYVNNQIRIGIGADGSNQTIPAIIYGIEETGGTNNFFHNGVYVGGTVTVIGLNDTAAFRSTVIPSLNGGTWRNNILVNARSNATTGGSHYARIYAGTSFDPFDYSNHNILFANGNGGVLGQQNGVDLTTLQDVKRATGQESSSAFTNPVFVNPDAATPDMRLQPVNPAEGAGTFVPVQTDFEGDTRATLTPVDIGADAGNYTSSGDFFPPSILYPILSNGSTADRILTGWLTVTDNVDIAGGTFAPRFYYGKNGGSYVSTQCETFSGLTEQSRKFTCRILYQLVGGVNPGDTITYFVVSQDISGNVNSNPAGAVATDVNTVTMPPLVTNSYNIVAPIGGTIIVGPGGFNSLTATGGFFEAVNNAVLTSDVTVMITGDTTEDGTHALNSLAQDVFPGNFTVMIQPADGTMKTLSGNATQSLFRFDGAEGVTIDGRFGGSGKFLTFRNSNTANSTILVQGGAGNDVFRFVNIEGANTNASSAVVQVLVNGTTGNDNIRIENSTIRDLSNATGVPANLFLSQGITGVPNTNIQIFNSELGNFTSTAIGYFENESALIQNNLICPTATFSGFAPENNLVALCQPIVRNTALTGIDFRNGDGIIDGNDFREFVSNLKATGIFTIGDINDSIPEVITITRNRVTIKPPPNSTGPQIAAQSLGGGRIDFVNNQFTIILNGSNQRAGGIQNDGFFGGNLNVYHNSVLLTGTVTGNNSTSAVEIGPSSQSNGVYINNIYYNFNVGGTGTGRHTAASLLSDFGTFTANYNVYSSASGAIFNYLGASVPFSQWQTSTGDDLNSLAGVEGGQFTATMFVDPLAGNLNINPGTGYDPSPIVSNRGTPIAGVTTDFNGNARSPTTPDIGSSEFNVDRAVGSDGTLPPGNYDNIIVGTGFNTLLGGGGVNVTLGGIINVSGTMSVSCSSTLLGASPLNYVVGNVKKDFCATGAFDYPVGTNTGYSPVNMNVTALNTNPSSLTVKANNGTAVSNPPLNDATTLDRFWSLTETGALTANLLFNYLDTDVDGNESNYRLIRIANGGAPFSMAGSIVNTTNNTLSLNNVTEFSEWTGGELAPTGARAVIGGRVVRADGNGIGKTVIVLQSINGSQPQYALTNPFGYFRFNDVAVGETYLISVSAKQYQFMQPTQMLFVIGDMENVTFVALE
jgi:hypothetical protein